MSEVNRSDMFVKSERGGEWFEEFLETYANSKQSYTQDIMDIIQEKRGETVQGVVDKYKEMVGLDSLANDDDESDIKVSASSNRVLSKRCASVEEQPNIIVILDENPDVKDGVESLCRHSGGTKGTHSIINFIREKLGKELASYSNEDLVQYVEDAKSRYKVNSVEPHSDIGAVGTEKLDNIDETADYILHGKGR